MLLWKLQLVFIMMVPWVNFLKAAPTPVAIKQQIILLLTKLDGLLTDMNQRNYYEICYEERPGVVFTDCLEEALRPYRSKLSSVHYFRSDHEQIKNCYLFRALENYLRFFETYPDMRRDEIPGNSIIISMKNIAGQAKKWNLSNDQECEMIPEVKAHLRQQWMRDGQPDPGIKIGKGSIFRTLLPYSR